MLLERHSGDVSSMPWKVRGITGPTAIFDPIFGAEDRRPPIFNFRSSKLKIEEPPIFDLRPRRMGRRSDERKRGGGTSSSEERRTPPSSTFSARRTKNPPSSIFSAGRMNEEPSRGTSSSDPPEHQLPSAILKSGSSDRSSSLKIGPKIEIGPLLVRGTLVFWANCSVGARSCPTPPRRPAVRPDPTRSLYVRVLDSAGN